MPWIRIKYNNENQKCRSPNGGIRHNPITTEPQFLPLQIVAISGFAHSVEPRRSARVSLAHAPLPTRPFGLAHWLRPAFSALTSTLYGPFSYSSSENTANLARRVQPIPPYFAWIGCSSLEPCADWLVSLPLHFSLVARGGAATRGRVRGGGGGGGSARRARSPPTPW